MDMFECFNDLFFCGYAKKLSISIIYYKRLLEKRYYDKDFKI